MQQDQVLVKVCLPKLTAKSYRGAVKIFEEIVSSLAGLPMAPGEITQEEAQALAPSKAWKWCNIPTSADQEEDRGKQDMSVP